MKEKIKSIVLKLFSLFFPGLKGRAVILMYHSVGNDDLFFTVSPKEFEKQLQYLKDKRLKVVPLHVILDRLNKKIPVDNLIAITFDDGYKDVYTNAFPLLRKYNFSATVFLISGLIGNEQMLSESNTSEMLLSGLVDFMPHSVTHTKLHKIPYDEAILEIENSRKKVEEITQKSANIFAYPKGRLTDEIAKYLAASGKWFGAVTTNTGLVRSGDDIFRLNRIPVDSATSFDIFKSKLSRGIEIYESLKRIFKKF